MPKSRKRKLPSAAKKARRMSRIAVRNVERRLTTQVHTLLPPGQGSRRNQFSSKSVDWEEI